MASYVLIPGAGGAASYWDRVIPLVEAAGHHAIAVDLPGPDPHAGLAEYVDLVVAASRPFPRVVVVAQSLGGFTAAMAAERLAVEELILVNAMIPRPGETPGAWWDATGAIEARERAAARGGYGEFAVDTYFLHDVDVTGLDPEAARPESDAVFASPCTFTSWPERVRALAGADDRFFPVEFQQRVARERLDVAVDVRPGGHLIALAKPETVAAYLLGQP
jgi:pimeloyl-ACP methyl ester carboxylesterase